MAYRVTAEYTQIPGHASYVEYTTGEEFMNDFLTYNGQSIDDFIDIIESVNPGLFTDEEKTAWSTAVTGETISFDASLQKLTRVKTWESQEMFEEIRLKMKQIDWFNPSIPAVYATGKDIAWTREFVEMIEV